MAFGGPNNYSGKDLRLGHAHLVEKGLNGSHFDAVIENLGATLTELNVPGELISEAAAIAESTRADVLAGYTDEEKKVVKAVKEQDGITQSTLRLRTDLHKSKLSIVLDGLEKKGLFVS